MKLSTALTAGVVVAGAAAAAAPAHATALATVYEGYNYSTGDNAFGYVTNTSGTTISDIIVNGTDYGALLAGASTASYSLGDSESCSNGCPGEAQNVSITIDGQTFTGSFADVWNDIDQVEPAIAIGTINGSIPEPASMAMLGAGLLGLAAARRRVA
jgi:hypothetical protein